LLELVQLLEQLQEQRYQYDYFDAGHVVPLALLAHAVHALSLR
jgi:hypothetical protein